MPTEPATAPVPDDLPPVWRSILSLFLFMHLFLAAIAVASNLAPAAWQMQVLSRFRMYTRLLNFDLNGARYHLTHATEVDVDHRAEVLPAGAEASDAGQWLVLPGGGWRGTESYQRSQRLAWRWAAEAQYEGDPALYAQALGTYFVRQRGVEPAQLRCRRHFLQSQEEVTSGTAARRNPEDPSFFTTVYAANAIVSESGLVEVVRIDDVGQVAQPVTGAEGAGGVVKP